MIQELRARTGLNRKDFAKYMEIPLRTLEDWEAGRRRPPEYVPTLMAYKLNYDELVRSLMSSGGKITNPFGQNAGQTVGEAVLLDTGVDRAANSSVIKIARPEFTSFDAQTGEEHGDSNENITEKEAPSENSEIDTDETKLADETKLTEGTKLTDGTKLTEKTESTEEIKPAEESKDVPKPKPWYAANNRPLFG